MTLKLITAALLIQTASAFDLSPGQPFPEIPLPAVPSVDEFGIPSEGPIRSVTNFRGQKLMLHVFASW